jgi:hypothetical protein
MKVIDQILLEWAYRCPDGIVDVNDPKKKAILDEILKEHNIDEINLNEVGDVSYDDVIKNALKVEEIPKVQGQYQLGKNININGEDAETFKKLYSVAPPKKGKGVETAGSKTTGNGEISMYWLFAHQEGHSAQGTQGQGKPDLNIDGKGVEVKAYDTPRITLGRFSSDSKNIELLNTLFGLDALVSSIDKTGDKEKKASALTFKKSDIVRAFNTLSDFSNNDELRDLSTKYPLIGNIYSRIDALNTSMGLKSGATAEDYAATLIKRILLRKFGEKPGFGGYLANVGENGAIEYRQINESDIQKLSNENVLENTYINQGSIIINPEEMFK